MYKRLVTSRPTDDSLVTLRKMMMMRCRLLCLTASTLRSGADFSFSRMIHDATYE